MKFLSIVSAVAPVVCLTGTSITVSTAALPTEFPLGIRSLRHARLQEDKGHHKRHGSHQKHGGHHKKHGGHHKKDVHHSKHKGTKPHHGLKEGTARIYEGAQGQAVQDIPDFQFPAGSPPLKVQFWDATYIWGKDNNGTCTTSIAGIEKDAAQAISRKGCPSLGESLGQVTPCAVLDDGVKAASGAVVKSPQEGVETNNMSEDDCKASVQSSPSLAGAVWFQMNSTQGTGTAQNFWFGDGANAKDGSFDAADTWGGVQMSWTDESKTSMNIEPSGGGGFKAFDNPIYMCHGPEFDADSCVHSKLYGRQGKPLPDIKKGDNGAYNIYFVSGPSN